MEHPPSPSFQLRLEYVPLARRLEVSAALEVLSVAATVAEPARAGELAAALGGVGVGVRTRSGGVVEFPISDIGALSRLPDTVIWSFSEELGPLAALASRPAGTRSPAGLEVGEAGDLLLRFEVADGERCAVLSPSAAEALLQADLPFVASDAAWEQLAELSSLPVRLARLRYVGEGWIEAMTAHPQVLETAPVRGLWRIDETRYGVARAFAADVQNLVGASWGGARPPKVERPGPLGPNWSFLPERDRVRALEVADRLAVASAAVLAWPSGMGRRFVALAAIDALDLWPCLIVTPPWGMWAWMRHLQAAGRSFTSSAGVEADARLVTYRDVLLGAHVEGAPSMVFDDLLGEEASRPEVRAALTGLDGLEDTVRVGVSAFWPEDVGAGLEALDVVRPGEFRLGGVPVELRYPLYPQQRVSEHQSAYVDRRERDVDLVEGRAFASSHVRAVTPSEAQRRAFEEAAGRLSRQGRPDRELLGEMREVVSSGPERSISPKVAAAARVVEREQAAGRRVVVVTSSGRAATLLRAACGAREVLREDDDVAASLASWPTVVLHWRRFLPDLRAADHVVLCDYPLSFAGTEAAVGSGRVAGDPSLTVLHAVGTVDDRVAVLAAGRPLGRAGLEDEEVRYLLRERFSGQG